MNNMKTNNRYDNRKRYSEANEENLNNEDENEEPTVMENEGEWIMARICNVSMKYLRMKSYRRKCMYEDNENICEWKTEKDKLNEMKNMNMKDNDQWHEDMNNEDMNNSNI